MDGHVIAYALAALALVVLFGVPLAALFCIAAAWLYNLFH